MQLLQLQCGHGEVHFDLLNDFFSSVEAYAARRNATAARAVSRIQDNNNKSA